MIYASVRCDAVCPVVFAAQRLRNVISHLLPLTLEAAALVNALTEYKLYKL